MARTTKAPVRRRGRPTGNTSGDTRERVLLAAQRTFAALGYEPTTNKAIADEAGITTGAIYHYFESKRDLYAAVLDHVSSVIYGRFREAAVGPDLRARVHAVLDAAVGLGDSDPSYAAFVVSVPTEAQRHAELADLAAVQTRASVDFWTELVEEGAGDLVKGVDPAVAIATLRMVSGGLARYASIADADEYHRSVDGLKRLIDHTMFKE